MGRENINFNLLSLNARGLQTFDRRKTFLSWLEKSSADICFLQETYSTSEVENIWKKQCKGDMFFSHRTGHSKGVFSNISKTSASVSSGFQTREN